MKYSGFVGSCFLLLSKRAKLLAFLSLLFFGCILVVAFLAGFLFQPWLYSVWGLPSAESLFGGNFFVMVFGIFALNLVLSGFVFVTLPGMVFFPLSAFALGFRGVLWGLLVYAEPVHSFAVVLPTLVLEGEAYVFAAAAGTVVGVSWVKPGWIGPEEAGLRSEAFGKALKDCLRLYVFVVVLLFVAAVVETVAILCVA